MVPHATTMADRGGTASATRRRTATSCAFAVAGAATAGWAALVPFVRARLLLNDADLGLLLLCPGIGSMLAMPLAGRLAGHVGGRLLTGVCAAALCLVLPVLAVVPDRAGLAVALLWFGGALGGLDVLMNLQAVRLERAQAGPLMSGFHGLYSAGGIAGALAMSVLLNAVPRNWSPPLSAVVILAVLLLAPSAATLPWLDPDPEPGKQPEAHRGRFAVRPVLLIGLMCAAAFLAEGAVTDWSALLLGREDGVSAGWSTAGFAVFSAAMTGARFGGDRLVHRVGAGAVLRGGALLAAAGLAVVAAGRSWPLGLLGFGLFGLGAANLAPLLIAAAGCHGIRGGQGAAVGVSVATTLGYGGILAGPGLLGFVSAGLGLPAAFLVLASLLAASSFGGRLLRA